MNTALTLKSGRIRNDAAGSGAIDRHADLHAAVQEIDYEDTIVSYFGSLREAIIQQLRDVPCRLTRAEAERGADEVMKIVKSSRRHSIEKDFGVFISWSHVASK